MGFWSLVAEWGTETASQAEFELLPHTKDSPCGFQCCDAEFARGDFLCPFLSSISDFPLPHGLCSNSTMALGGMVLTAVMAQWPFFFMDALEGCDSSNNI